MMTIPRYLAALSLFFLFNSNTVQAQIVDVLSEANAEHEDGFSGSGDASWEERQDNSSYSIYTLTSQNFYRMEKHVLMLLLSREYGEQNDERFSDSSFAHLRYRYQWGFWEWEAFLQYDSDPFRRLSSRKLIGTGPKYNLLTRDDLSLSVGLAVMKEYEEYEETKADLPEESLSSEKNRLSIAYQLKYKLDDRLSLESSGYHQPEISNWDNARTTSSNALVFSLTEYLEFKFSYQTSRDSEPPEGVQKVQTKITNTLSFKY